MGLSYDLISEFVKITNDKKENTKEGTVYATVVSGTGGKYVQIDGSDLLTPTDTTTDIEDGERVTLMIKDHKAIVTGNVTTPSASTSKVDKVTESINSVSDRVGTFELVVADKISTKELEAYKATIEVLVAKKATIEDLTATNAKIENLEVKNAEIENLVAEKATITDLEAVNATIENLKAKDAEIEHAVVENLEATTADIKILNADFAQIKTLVNGNLTSDNILSFKLTSEKVTVDDAFIKDAMIDTISAGKINAGEINTNLVSIGSEDGGMLITGSTQQFTDKNGNVRIQIGKDASGDFTFILYGEDGKGQLINQNGITASAISDGLIVNDMVSDHAAISGGKLDISSVITEINSDNSTTIKSSKIYLNDQAQSLEVAFNSLKTQVDTIQEITIQGDLTAIVEQVQSNTSKIEANKNSINTLISEDTVIKKQVTDLQGTLSETETTLNSKYTSLSQNLDGFKTTVADTYATKKSVTDVVDNIETNYSTTSVMNSAIEQKSQEISASVSSTYATKNQVNTLDNNLKTNYSTTKQMESAINVAKEEINLGVSSIYETKENSTSKIQNAVNNIQVGGTNLLPGTKLLTAGNVLSSSISSDTYLGFKIMHHKQTADGFIDTYRFDGYISVEPNTEYTLSFYAKGSGVINSFLYPNAVAYGENSIGNTTNSPDGNILTTVTNEWKRYWITWKTLSNASELKTLIISRINKGNDIYICGAKLEKGNKATEWSPAPEDIDTSINNAKTEAITSANNTLTSTIANYYTKEQTNSQINVAKEEINLGVSSKYMTKTNVETKVTSTLNSAKSYADTKKSEAISTAASDATSKANTAKQEAISSANNTLTSTIANYYTKAQTDSQINIAKDAINLGVSNTYETKSNVTTKISNAITSANNTLNTTIKNYYTKNETNSQIDIAKNAVTTSVSSLRTEVMNSTYTNLLANSDFLIGSPIPKGYWTNNTDCVSMSDWIFYGSKAIRINVSGTSALAWIGIFSTWVKAIEGQRFTASAYIATSHRSGLDQGCCIEIEWYDSNENRIDTSSQSFLPQKDDTWERVSVTGTAPRGTVKARVRVHVNRNGILYATRMMLQEGEITTAWVRGGDIDVIEERLMSAEQKITDESITNTVKKNFYTKTETENAITSKGYATQSQVQQTADNIQFKFTQTGGYNLVRNGNPKPWHEENWWVSDNGWWYRGNSRDLGIQTNDTNEAYAGSATFKVEPGKTYSFSCWLMAESNTKGIDVYFVGSAYDDGAYTEIHHLYGGSGDYTWVNAKVTFTLGSNINYGFIRIDNNGRKDTSADYDTVVWFSEVQMVKGSECYPQWSPNPNEVYDGVTTIDKDGIKVSASNINGYTHMTNWGFFVNKGGKDVVSIDDRGLRLFDAEIQLTHANGNKYFFLDENGIIMYNPDNGTHQWGKIAAINGKFTIASNGNSSGLSLGHHVNDNYVEDILCDSYGYLTIHRQMNHNGIYYNNYGQIFVRQQGQGGWEITGRSDSQSIKPSSANQGSLGSNTQYINNSWVAIRNNPSSIEVKHVSHYVEDNECISLVNGVKPARYFYKEYDEEGNDITTFTTKSSQLGLIYEDVRECSARDLITNEEDKGINLYSMISVLWGATRNVNTRLNDAEYEIVLLKEEIEQLKNKLGEK